MVGYFFLLIFAVSKYKNINIMTNNAEVTQLVYNIITLEWRLDLHIRGCNQRVKVTADEASGIITSFTQEDQTRMSIEKGEDVIYYIPRTK